MYHTKKSGNICESNAHHLGAQSLPTCTSTTALNSNSYLDTHMPASALQGHLHRACFPQRHDPLSHKAMIAKDAQYPTNTRTYRVHSGMPGPTCDHLRPLKAWSLIPNINDRGGHGPAEQQQLSKCEHKKSNKSMNSTENQPQNTLCSIRKCSAKQWSVIYFKGDKSRKLIHKHNFKNNKIK